MGVSDIFSSEYKSENERCPRILPWGVLAFKAYIEEMKQEIKTRKHN